MIVSVINDKSDNSRYSPKASLLNKAATKDVKLLS